MTDSIQLEGRRVRLRPAAESDADTLVSILAEPEVARWWPPFDRTRVLGELIAERADEAGYAIEHDGRVVGYIQAAQEPDPEFRHASIDLFLSSASQGQGLGPDAIRTLAVDLIDRGGHHRITIDPLVANTRAISAYAKAGFRPVGRLREYQRMPDGTWADGLLMEMLAAEVLRDPPGGTP